jgi:hypothetical protein
MTAIGSDLHEWTSCEVHGHAFRDAAGEPTPSCVDCGEPRSPDGEMLVWRVTWTRDGGGGRFTSPLEADARGELARHPGATLDLVPSSEATVRH